MKKITRNELFRVCVCAPSAVDTELHIQTITPFHRSVEVNHGRKHFVLCAYCGPATGVSWKFVIERQTGKLPAWENWSFLISCASDKLQATTFHPDSNFENFPQICYEKSFLQIPSRLYFKWRLLIGFELLPAASVIDRCVSPSYVNPTRALTAHFFVSRVHSIFLSNFQRMHSSGWGQLETNEIIFKIWYENSKEFNRKTNQRILFFIIRFTSIWTNSRICCVECWLRPRASIQFYRFEFLFANCTTASSGPPARADGRERSQ